MKAFSSKRILFLSGLCLSTLTLSGCGSAVSETYSIPSIEIWGVFDDSDAYDKAISAYKEANPFVKSVSYRKLPVETYKEDLINALAAGKGPDIFMIRNSWRASFEDKTAPAPDALLPERTYRDALVDVAASDFIGTDGKIYGIPLSVDSLGLYYNKDIFNAAGISRPPETWDEVVEDARILNTIDQFGSITRSGIALGTGTNINRSSDILTVLMMQLGSKITDRKPESAVSFVDEKSRQAFDFYTQFSRVGSDVYSWNARQDYSIDAFYKGNLAMMVNYSWQYETIKQKNAKLNIGMVPLPQFNAASPVNLANYWGFVVAKDKPAVQQRTSTAAVSVDPAKQNFLRTFESWQFLKFLALAGKDQKITLINGLSGTAKEVPLTSDPTREYLEKTHKPAARRDLVAEQKNDLTLSAFVYGNLIAKNWYQGDAEAADGILIDAIDSVVRGERTVQSALETAGSRINLLRNH
ncbi:MAG: extracellular solute-binding protein [Candidatus Moranbacteria bacterium]|nr:extracellular solute-binding protein [Candidatus Moranbacteria bacterium]